LRLLRLLRALKALFRRLLRHFSSSYDGFVALAAAIVEALA
jgi:hypothetical protein